MVSIFILESFTWYLFKSMLILEHSSRLNCSLTNTPAVSHYFNFTNAKRSFTLPKKIVARFAFCNPQ